jgi:hypothetical protein
MGCHCIEIGRSFIGKDKRPLRAFCWGATQVHPIKAEDHAIGLVEYEGGAISQFEVSWTFRGGMDLRDEVSGTEGTIRLDHFLRTGFEMFTAAGESGYVAEKAEGQIGWLFPVGDEAHELGYVHMFQDMLDALEAGRAPVETFYDGYVVNAIIDSCYKSMKSGRWEPVEVKGWQAGVGMALMAERPKESARKAAKGRNGVGATPAKGPGKASGRPQEAESGTNQGKRAGKTENQGFSVIKTERLPDGRTKRILKDKATGRIVERIE